MHTIPLILPLRAADDEDDLGLEYSDDQGPSPREGGGGKGSGGGKGKKGGTTRPRSNAAYDSLVDPTLPPDEARRMRRCATAPAPCCCHAAPGQPGGLPSEWHPSTAFILVSMAGTTACFEGWASCSERLLSGCRLGVSSGRDGAAVLGCQGGWLLLPG
jgi:hypothetical protein